MSGKNNITKKTLVAWDQVCLPKGAGRRNVISMKVWNQAALCKLLWTLKLKKGEIMIKWMHTYYIRQQNWQTRSIPP